MKYWALTYYNYSTSSVKGYDQVKNKPRETYTDCEVIGVKRHLIFCQNDIEWNHSGRRRTCREKAFLDKYKTLICIEDTCENCMSFWCDGFCERHHIGEEAHKIKMENFRVHGKNKRNQNILDKYGTMTCIVDSCEKEIIYVNKGFCAEHYVGEEAHKIHLKAVAEKKL